jgi:hypothetical protein
MDKWKFFTVPGLELRPLVRTARSQSLYRRRYAEETNHLSVCNLNNVLSIFQPVALLVYGLHSWRKEKRRLQWFCWQVCVFTGIDPTSTVRAALVITAKSSQIIVSDRSHFRCCETFCFPTAALPSQSCREDTVWHNILWLDALSTICVLWVLQGSLLLSALCADI